MSRLAAALAGLGLALDRLAPGWHPLRLAPVRRLVMWLIAWRRPEVLPVKHGFRLRIPMENRSPFVLRLYLDGEYEAEESRVLLEILESPARLDAEFVNEYAASLPIDHKSVRLSSRPV